jgi:wobble nucleotide-excising tRNase
VPLFVQYPDCAGLTHQVQQMLARSVVSKTLPELVADPTVAAWVGQGLPLHTGDKATANCRFCDQPLPAERLRQLQAHFNDEFRSFQRDVDALILTVESAKERIATIQPPSKALLYPHLMQDPTFRPL